MAALTSEKSEEGRIVQQNEKTPACVGLESYKEDQSGIFFGREEEKNELYKLIKKSNLVIFFGKSGTGKTSLLNAGVFPLLRKNHCFPFRIRFELDGDGGNIDLVGQVKKVLKADIAKYKFKVSVQPQNETLYEYFHKERLWDIITPVLIFDQFEEIFTLKEQSRRFKKQLHALMDELSSLIENNIPESVLNRNEVLNFSYQKPKAKVVFCFREDYLPEVESLIKTVLPFYHSRYRLLPMNGSQASEVITKTWKDKISRNETSKIINFLTHEDLLGIQDEKVLHERYETIDIEPSLLSQVSFCLEQRRRETHDLKISAELLERVSKDEILKAIYEEDLGRCKHEAMVVEFIEENLITENGARNKFPIDKIDEVIREDIGELKQVYLVRFENNNVELIHDVLTSVIKQKRDSRRSEIALAEAKENAGRKIGRYTKLFLTFMLLLGLSALIVFVVFAIKKQQETEIGYWQDLYYESENKNNNLEKINNEIKNQSGKLDSLLDRQKMDYKYLMATKDSIAADLNLVTTRLAAEEEKNNESRLEINKLRNSYKIRGDSLKSYMAKSRTAETNLTIPEREQYGTYSIIIYPGHQAASYPGLKRRLEEVGFNVRVNKLINPDRNEILYYASSDKRVARNVAGIINQCCGLPLLSPELSSSNGSEREIKIMLR